MSNRNSISHSHDLLAEMQDTEGTKNWKEELLTRLGSALGPWGNWAKKVGTGKNEMQIRYKQPINSMFSFGPLDLLWVQFNVLEPQTKEHGTQVVRFGPDTAVLMTLVKIPDKDSFKWYMLARKKYQFAAGDLFFEESRGWIPNTNVENQGIGLLNRDFPGLKTSPIVKAIDAQMIGSQVWENNSQQANKISYHLVVVELKEEISSQDLEKLLVSEKIRQEHQGKNLESVTAKDLRSQPTVLELEVAASYLNAHTFTGKKEDLFRFGENFSGNIWARFLGRHGWQFPTLMPEQGKKL